MSKFEELIKKAEISETGEIYYKCIKFNGVIGKTEFYIDPRTERNENGLHTVKPFCFLNGYYWYVCPNCGGIHHTDRIGKIESGCCMDIDCQRWRTINGCYQLVQYAPIIIAEIGCE